MVTYKIFRSSYYAFCAPQPKKNDRNFAFLQALSHDFGGRYTKRRIKYANSYAFDKEFKPVLRATMHHYNINRAELGRDGRVNHLLARVEDLKSVLGQNLTLLLEREHHLDSLVAKSEQARRDSMVFKRKSVKVKKHYEMKSWKMWFLIFFSLLIMFYTIMTSICGGFRWEQCRATSWTPASNSNNDDASG